MKKSKQKPSAPRRPVPAAKARDHSQLYFALVTLAALVAALVAYGPSLDGEFVLDDSYLPFTAAEFANAPLASWLQGVRPVLNFTFWVNYRTGGLDTFGYHLGNVLLHALGALVVLLALRRVIELAGEDRPRAGRLAAFGAAVFLLHPIQTESVAYVASRSELLSVALFNAAFLVFLCRRREAIGWLESLAVLALFGAAVTTKEHTAVLPALLLLTDYFWNPPFSLAGARKNWRLYTLFVGGAAAASWWVLDILRASNTAGLNLTQVKWHEYFFTQCRAIWFYVRLFVLPFGLNADHDFAYSRGPDAAALAGLAGLIAVAVAAIVYRRRFPLASYGVLVFLLLLAPTSSFVPIMDPVAERRMYLPFIGLLLVVLEFGRRVRIRHAAWAAAGVCAVLFAATYARSGVWSTAISLWEDTVAKSPRKYRPHFQLAYAYFLQRRCPEALKHYEAAGSVARNPEYSLYLDWALAYDCTGNVPKAIEKLEQAVRVSRNAHVFAIMGMIYGKHGHNKEALQALDTAVQLDPGFQPTYVYRGATYASASDYERARAEYRRALALNPGDEGALKGLAFVEQRLAGR